MFNFINELCEVAGLPYEDVSSNIKIYWVKNLMVVSNFKKVVNYTNENVVILSKDNKLNIEGEEIKINQFSKDEIILSGKFNRVYFER